MTQSDIPQDDILEAARRLTDGRMEAVRQVVNTIATIKEAEAAMAVVVRAEQVKVDAARVASAKAYEAALRAGWSEVELRKVGIPAPGKKLPAAKRGRRRKAAPEQPEKPWTGSGLAELGSAKLPLDDGGGEPPAGAGEPAGSFTYGEEREPVGAGA